VKNYDDNFKIGIKTKKLFADFYDLLANIPRKDHFLWDKMNNKTFELLETIYLLNSYEEDNIQLRAIIKSNLATIDFLLEILYRKKYLSMKQIEKVGYQLKEITRMTAKWKTKAYE